MIATFNESKYIFREKNEINFKPKQNSPVRPGEEPSLIQNTSHCLFSNREGLGMSL